MSVLLMINIIWGVGCLGFIALVLLLRAAEWAWSKVDE